MKCRYRNKQRRKVVDAECCITLISQENIETIEGEELALKGYTLEIIRILKRRQQANANKTDTQKEKRTREEGGQKTRTEENIEGEELGGQEVEQDLERRERVIDGKIIENQGKLHGKEKKRKRGK